MALTPEQALELLGRYNRWQIRTWLVFCFGCIIPASWMLMGFVFIGDVPYPYRCAVPEGVPVNESIPLVPGEDGEDWKYASCEMYANISVSEETVPCQNGYWYDPASGYTATLVSEFDLVCGRESMVELAMFVNNMGAIFGNLFFSRLADMFGRKTIFLLCLWSNIPVAISQAFAPSLLFYICMSFVDGAQQEGMGLTAATLSIEHFAIDQRTFASGGISLAWALGYMSLSGLAYVFRNWRHLLLACTLPLLASISFYWLIDESLAWLVANNKKQKADKILRKAARMCRVTLPDVLFDDSVTSTSTTSGDAPLISQELVTNNGDRRDLNQSDELSSDAVKDTSLVDTDKHVVTMTANGDEKHTASDDDIKQGTLASKQQQEDDSDIRQVFIKEGETLKRVIFKRPCFGCCAKQEREEKYDYGFCDILRRPKLRLFAFSLWFIWFANGIGYYSLSFTVTYLPGDRYLNQFLYALVETPATIITIAVIYYIGRRKPLAFFHALAGVSLICTVVQTFDCCRDMSVLIVALSIIGKFSFSATYIVIYMLTPEIFPTNLRNVGLGMCQLSACIGSNLVPLMRILSRSYSWATPLIVGVVSLMAACLTLVLPETRHTPLPESLADVDNLAQAQSKPSGKPSQPST